MKRLIPVLLLISILCFFATAAESNPFFAFDNGVYQGEWTPDQQAALLAELGYAGISYSGVADLDARLAAFEKHGIKVFNLYVPCYVDKTPAYSEELVAAIKRLKGTDVALWLTVQGKADDDTTAVRVVGEVADLAAESDLKVALYPHAGFYVDSIEDATRITKKVARANQGVTFNLCHELKAGNEARFDELLDQAAPHLFFVSINGANHEGNWDTLIQTLDRGTFDVYALLQKLRALNYTGPVGLQCYQVPGDARENLTRSLAQWNAFTKRLDKEKS